MSIEAMKQALAKVRAAQQCHPNAVMTLLCEADETLRTAIEQAEKQEPVAWLIWLHGPAGLFENKQFAEHEFARRNQEYPDKDRKLRPLIFGDTTPPAAQPAVPAIPDLTHDQWDAWQDKWQVMLEREALDDLRAMLTTPPAAQPAPVQEPVSNGKLNVTLQDTPTEIELARYKRMFEAACSALGEVSEALGCDPNEGGSEPLIEAIARLKSSSYEPIAWMVYTLDGKSVFVTDNPTDFTDEHRALPLYTTPPAAQREWVGLTDDEVSSLMRQFPDHLTWGIARAIEAKLREKNGGGTK